MPMTTSAGNSRRGEPSEGRPGSPDERADGYEYAPVRIPPGTDRATAAVQLTLQAEYGGWELDTVRLLADGTRRVRLRRRLSRPRVPLPGLSY